MNSEIRDSPQMIDGSTGSGVVVVIAVRSNCLWVKEKHCNSIMPIIFPAGLSLY